MRRFWLKCFANSISSARVNLLPNLQFKIALNTIINSSPAVFSFLIAWVVCTAQRFPHNYLSLVLGPEMYWKGFFNHLCVCLSVCFPVCTYVWKLCLWINGFDLVFATGISSTRVNIFTELLFKTPTIYETDTLWAITAIVNLIRMLACCFPRTGQKCDSRTNCWLIFKIKKSMYQRS